MAQSIHRTLQHGSALDGAEAVSLFTDRTFPRHAHDALGIGLIHRGAHRSWSGIGPAEAEAGDVITVNPGEMHDGLPVGGRARGWRMVYMEPAALAAWIGEDVPDGTEIARPALRDPGLAAGFARAFARLTAPVPDQLAAEEALLACLVCAFGRHGSRRPARPVAPSVAAARRRLDEAPHRPATLGELAALSGVSRFQLIRGFARDLGATPHAYAVQARVRAARRHIAAGLPLAEAALLSGFADQSHLTRAFVRQLGLTPGRYRTALR